MLVDKPLLPNELIKDEDERGKILFLIENIESLLSATSSGSLNVAITGDWGSGKTTYLKALESFYRDHRKCPVCFFEAWKYQDDENPLVPLLLEIREIKGNPPDIKKKITRIIKPLVASGIVFTDILLRKATGRDMEDVIKALKLVEKDYVKFISRYKENLDQIRETMREVSEKFESASSSSIWEGYITDDRYNNNVFVLIIDDLDRLIPERAFRMIEALRFYFDVDNTLILMGLNDEIINKHVCERYMTGDIEGEDFLEKIFHWKYELSYTRVTDLHLRGIRDVVNKEKVGELQNLLTSIDNLTHRKWIKLLNRIEAGLRAYGESGFYNIILEAFLKELYPHFELFSRRFPMVLDHIREQTPPGGAEEIFRDAVKRICNDRTFLTYPDRNYAIILGKIRSLLKIRRV